jgi:uncharacterized protein YjbJ (UPF0337 family)
LTGNTPLQIKGIGQQVKGKVENAWGKAKDAVNAANNEARTQNDRGAHGTGVSGGPDRKQ